MRFKNNQYIISKPDYVVRQKDGCYVIKCHRSTV